MKGRLQIGLFLAILAAGPSAGQEDFLSRMDHALRLQRLADYAGAQELLVAILKNIEASNPADPRIAAVLNNLGAAYQYQDRYAEAERSFRKALEISRRNWGTDDMLTVRVATNLASLYIEAGHFAKAERLGMDALAARHGAWQSDHPDLTRLIATIGAIAFGQGRYADAENAYRTALAAAQRSRPDSEDVLQFLNNLGVLYQRVGRNAEALSHCERALAFAERLLPPHDGRRAKLMLSIARLQLLEHGPQTAEPFYRQALAVGEAALGGQHPIFGEILVDYASVLQRLGRKGEAKPFDRRGKAILDAAAKADPARHTVDVSELPRVP